MSEDILPITIPLEGEKDTIRLGEDLALALKPGDCLALIGDLGTGKSTLARAFISAVADEPDLEVPSPTFTIIQTYDARIPVAHLDLYRLSDVSELDELGIDEMLEDGICLIEWPDIATDILPPEQTVTLTLTHSGEGRLASIEAPAKLKARLERVFAIRAFLAKNGRGDAARRFLSGDASTRAYETVSTGGPDLILMDWRRPMRGAIVAEGKTYAEIAHLAQDARSFVAIGNYLRNSGFCAPEILAADTDQGILLLENLGREGVLAPDGTPIEDRYLQSVACLAALHEASRPDLLPVGDGSAYEVPPFDRQAMKIEVSLLAEWYLPHKRGKPLTDSEKSDYYALWDRLIDQLADCETGLVLRDFHSPNLIWQPQNSGIRQVGLIDFQDAMIGPTAYDVASIVQDARVTISPELQARLLSHYLENRRSTPFDEAAFLKAFAIMSAQRNCKLAGIWVRLLERDRKPGYMKHMPRTFRYLSAALSHPELAPLRDWCLRIGIEFND
ncbi:tRNA (adenosine(37)-N6)-threonylcarbamoyltransferase complex ATPase subunit type 1 TsaE [Agrobacterium tumefaciens]|uniref:tRNA (adenosine(37)-N6)-threonylcarbamoyltransferase complex ATPase subunit type 1 TsaE n=1 Tax=Agrobacterium tumefaciens TaxID=358 RepID=UPI000EF230A9|nr:tRNA (adenosine(37)-N6)-threonylcarbamoyltransferase complex ATPase subunit type 1 TsaE [Agrobacterium tumefaciens]AYM06757.1 chlorosome protein [Agrobacterium tumefaciens]NSZ33774.1 tRNA (adenosine(37)-N6)-threonylcarbamoyltransferase complex ATPase subunit type 1 TsaE [Agrobacterium tumefaciens]QLG23132.1 tRNA (adenosine(37)-N6)-threonylcarbamoyltransferase complex ATPase subunit type 1 TsaE [Agrobacterium tumefaciens]UXS87014.1 tRNA (adenosine(37)-N6)-threonylcarbamoyltransferase complex 